jgi:hypothetical protein
MHHGVIYEQHGRLSLNFIHEYLAHALVAVWNNRYGGISNISEEIELDILTLRVSELIVFVLVSSTGPTPEEGTLCSATILDPGRGTPQTCAVPECNPMGNVYMPICGVY